MFRTIGMLGSSVRGRTATLNTVTDPPRRRGLRARLRANAVTRVPYLGLIALTARLLRWVRARVRAWTAWLGRRRPWTRAVVAVALTAGTLAIAGTAYILLYGTPTWLPGWVPLTD
jgi:hypothetical protein